VRFFSYVIIVLFMGQPINASKGVIGMDSDWIRMDSNLDITIYHILIQIHINIYFIGCIVI
jgi:hypothetical protein